MPSKSEIQSRKARRALNYCIVILGIVAGGFVYFVYQFELWIAALFAVVMMAFLKLAFR